MRHPVRPESRSSRPVRVILIAVAVVGLAALLWAVSDAIMIAFGSIVVAVTLRAATDPLARWTGMKERWALMTVILVLLMAGAFLSWQFGREATRQFAEMKAQIPAALEKLHEWLSESKAGQMALDMVRSAGEESGGLAKATVALGATLNGVGDALLIIVIGVYLAVDPRLYRNGALRLLPVSRRAQVGRAFDASGLALRKWLMAQLVVMAAVGTLTGAGLALLGIPLWLSLGILAGLLEFIPVIGPILAAIPAVLIAFAQGPTTALYVLGLSVAVQQIESNALTPLVQRWAAELPPVIALIAIVVGGLLFGVMGILFATPLAVVLMVLVRKLYVEDTLERPAASPEVRSRRLQTADTPYERRSA